MDQYAEDPTKLTLAQIERLISQSFGQLKRDLQKAWVDQFKETDPKGYEAYLEETDPKGYEAYLEETDPEGYQAYINYMTDMEDSQGELNEEHIKDTPVTLFNPDSPRNKY
jgi:hypothetical protein